MAAITLENETIAHDGPRPARGMFHDTWVVARRGLVHMKRQPEALADATIQPIMFVLLFAYVFGGAISVPAGGNYREFLMGGIFAQTIVFTAFGVAMSLAGLLIGWRIRDGLVSALLGYLLLFAFAFAMIWVGILLGSLVATPEAVQGIGFAVIFPITFMASTFVPTETMPGFLKTIAEWNPVTTLSNAARELFGNPSTVAGPDAPWSIAHPIEYSIIWTIAIVAVCAPLAVRTYQRSVAK